MKAAPLPVALAFGRFRAVPGLAIATLLPAAEPAWAGRPFDGTDAGIAPPGVVELELQPAGYLDGTGGKSLLAPYAVVNLGLGDSWELSVEGQNLLALDAPAGSSPARAANLGATLKRLFVPGSLQGLEGPSVAGELTGGVPDPHASLVPLMTLTGAVSQRWTAGTLHLSGAMTLDPATDLTAQHIGWYGGTIAEGPDSWPVRPVAEVVVERTRDPQMVYSGLAGLLWPLDPTTAIDFGLRYAIEGRGDAVEVRAGYSTAFGGQAKTASPVPKEAGGVL